MKKPRIRMSVVAITLAVLLLLIGALLAWMTIVPGRSYHGPVPEAEPLQLALRSELEADVRALAETIGERNLTVPQSLVAAQLYVEARLRDTGLATAREEFPALGHPCANLVAELPGTTRAAEIVVVGAHYDTAIGSPGANDNATGVAALLALARRLAQSSPARTLRFVAFVNEEPPFFETDGMGSRVHARASRARNDGIVAMLSLETLGCYSDDEGSQRYPSPLLSLVYPSRGDFVTFVGDLRSRSLMREAIGTFREHARIPSEGGALPGWVPGVGWSDHRSFWLEGWPAVMVTDTALFRDPHYHRSSDRAQNVDFARLALVVAGLEAVIAHLANPASSP